MRGEGVALAHANPAAASKPQIPPLGLNPPHHAQKKRAMGTPVVLGRDDNVNGNSGTLA